MYTGQSDAVGDGRHPPADGDEELSAVKVVVGMTIVGKLVEINDVRLDPVEEEVAGAGELDSGEDVVVTELGTTLLVVVKDELVTMLRVVSSATVIEITVEVAVSSEGEYGAASTVVDITKGFVVEPDEDAGVVIVVRGTVTEDVELLKGTAFVEVAVLVDGPDPVPSSN